MNPLTDTAGAPDLIPGVVGAAIRIVLILALVGAGAWVVLRWHGRGRKTRQDLQVLDRAFLARGTSVVLVGVAGKRLLVGASESGVRLLADLGPEQRVPRAREFDKLLTEVSEDKRRAG